MLEEALEAQKVELAAAQRARSHDESAVLQRQRQEYEDTIKRHLGFIDRSAAPVASQCVRVCVCVCH